MSFAGLYVERKTRRSQFFKLVDAVINWEEIDREIKKIYKRGKSADGRPSYSGLILFKMQLISIWFNLSDEATEDMVNDSLASMKFCGLELEDSVPDHSTLSRFRKELTEKKSYDRLLRKINKQLETKRIKINTGKGIEDASITESPFEPKGKNTYEIAEDRKEDDRDPKDIDKENKQATATKKTQPGVDSEGRWIKKGNELKFGYKKHTLTNEDGLVEAVHTTAANVHDSKGLAPLINKISVKKLEKGLFADKGMQVPDNVDLLKRKGIKNRIQYKAYRNRPLTKWQKSFNSLVSKVRYVVERTFGGMKRWFGAGKARYKGLLKVHAQHGLEAIAYNLYRVPGIIMSR